MPQRRVPCDAKRHSASIAICLRRAANFDFNTDSGLYEVYHTAKPNLYGDINTGDIGVTLHPETNDRHSHTEHMAHTGMREEFRGKLA